jgi:hypothetical protein
MACSCKQVKHKLINQHLLHYNKWLDSLRAGRGPGIESRWGARFSAPVQTGPGAHPASYTTGTGPFPVVKRKGCGVDHSPHLAPRLMKEKSYTSTPALGLRGLFYGDLYLYLYNTWLNNKVNQMILHRVLVRRICYDVSEWSSASVFRVAEFGSRWRWRNWQGEIRRCYQEVARTVAR